MSTAYDWIYQSLRALRLNAARFAISVAAITSVAVLITASPSALDDLFYPEVSWHPAHHMLVYPP
jgi:hypothetical protein